MSLKSRLYLGCCAAAMFAGCSVVDEDLDDCGADIRMNYELHLVTNMSTELNNVLNNAGDQYVATSLRSYLKDIFTDQGHDLNLSFYDAMLPDSSLLQQESEVMDASRASYTFYMPVHRYMHTASANIENNKMVSLDKTEQCHGISLPQVKADTISSHTTGIFTGRLPVNVLNAEGQEFDMYLYMANCAAALVIDTSYVKVNDVRIYTTGFATDFSLCDSIYTYGTSPIVRADNVAAENGYKMAFCSVNYPSPDLNETRLVTETTEPFISEDTEKTFWQYRCYVTMPDGKITETILSVRTPLRAGQLKIVKTKIESDGSVIPIADSSVGITVTLDWKQGDTYEPIF